MTFPMAMLRSLKPNWNSYGAPAIDERCIQKAYELWRQLAGEWQVIPCNDGGVQLEQHRDGFDIEITVSGSSQETFHGDRAAHARCDEGAQSSDPASCGRTTTVTASPVTTFKAGPDGPCEHCGLSFLLHIEQDEHGRKDVCMGQSTANRRV